MKKSFFWFFFILFFPMFLVTFAGKNSRKKDRRDVLRKGRKTPLPYDKKMWEESVKAIQSNNAHRLISLFERHSLDPSYQFEFDRTLLHFAVAKNKSQMVKTLLLLGADPNQQDLFGNTPCHFCTMMDVPLARGALINWEPEHSILSDCYIEPDFEIKNLNGETPGDWYDVENKMTHRWTLRFK